MGIRIIKGVLWHPGGGRERKRREGKVAGALDQTSGMHIKV